MPKITQQDFLNAAQEGDLALIQTYHQHGGDLHLNQDEALRWSAGNGHLDIVQYLLHNGADLHADQDCALRWSANNGYLPVVQYLLIQGAHVHADNDQALWWSAEEGHLPVVQCLVQYGADVLIGIDAAQDQPQVLAWLEDYQRMQHEQKLLRQETTAPCISSKTHRF